METMKHGDDGLLIESTTDETIASDERQDIAYRSAQLRGNHGEIQSTYGERPGSTLSPGHSAPGGQLEPRQVVDRNLVEKDDM